MMHVLYAMEGNALKRYISVKDELYQAKKSMSPADVSAAKQEIIAAAKINDIKQDVEIEDQYEIDANGIAHIPVVGMLTNSVDPCAAFFGESVTTYNFIKEAAISADNNPDVKEIYFDFNTNGGHVDGCDVTGQVIASLKKPTTGVNHGAALSAGYWLISQCNKIVSITPTAFYGSIGVAVEFISTKMADKNAGIERIVLTSTDAPNKRVDITTKTGQDKIIAELDDLHSVFVARVANGRTKATGKKYKPDDVNQNFGNGGILIAGNAIRVGMVDKNINDISDMSLESVKDPEMPKIPDMPEIPEEPENKLSTHTNEKSPAVNAGENKERFKKMKLKQFLEENPDAMAEYKADIRAEVDKVENRIAVVTPYLGKEEYQDAMPMAMDVLNGKSDIPSFKGAIGAFDMLRAKKTDAAAETDTKEIGDTKAGDIKQPSANGDAKKPEDISSAVSEAKSMLAGVI